MSFHALELSIEVIRELKDPLRRLCRHDRDLSRQLRRALSSVPLNLSEGDAGREGIVVISGGSLPVAPLRLTRPSAWRWRGDTSGTTMFPRVSSCSTGSWRCSGT